MYRQVSIMKFYSVYFQYCFSASVAGKMKTLDPQKYLLNRQLSDSGK